MTFETKAQAREFIERIRQSATPLVALKLQREPALAIIQTTHGYWTYTDPEQAKRTAKVCSICYQPFHEHGNNAQPVNDGVCCNYCDDHIVIPARMAQGKLTVGTATQ